MSARQTMPAALKAAWIADLRNPKRKQCTEQLSDGKGGFCCLGRLMVAACGKTYDPEAEGLPPQRFLDKYEISFQNPRLTIDGVSKVASEHNDTGATFAQIADAIERDVEGV